MPHPVLDQQVGLEGGVMPGVGSAAPPETDMISPTQVGEWGSKMVPNTVAAMVVGAVVTLIALRAAGFRFSFGVNVGGGA